MAMFQLNPFLGGNPYFANNPFLRGFSFGDAPRPVAPQTPAAPPVGFIGGGQGVGLLSGQLGGDAGGPGSGPGPSGGSSGSSPSGGVAPAGTSGDIGIGGKIGSAAQGMIGAAVPGGMLANTAITGLNVANHNSELDAMNAPNIGLMGALSAVGNTLTGGMVGTSAAQQAAQNAIGTPAAQGIGVPTSSVDFHDAPTTSASGTDANGNPSGGAASAAGGVNGGGANGMGVGGGDASDGGDGYAKGGVIVGKDVKGNAPDKVDDGWAQVKVGEGVLNKGAVGLLGQPLLNALNALGTKLMAGQPTGRGFLG